jgi:non-specific serine/threonine protein kinase/serine/threonine-protein kinase
MGLVSEPRLGVPVRRSAVNGFAADVTRYLAGDAVQARPPSTAYRVRKFVRRHRGQVVAASLVLLALLAGIVGTTWGLVEARRQAGIACDEARAKELARAAEAERADGERQARLDAQRQTARAEEAAAAERAASRPVSPGHPAGGGLQPDITGAY